MARERLRLEKRPYLLGVVFKMRCPLGLRKPVDRAAKEPGLQPRGDRCFLDGVTLNGSSPRVQATDPGLGAVAA